MESKTPSGSSLSEEQLLADFFENAAVGLHWVDRDGKIVRANRAELELLGYSKEEYVGRHIAEFHADASAIKDILAKLGRGETINSYRARLRCKDGSLRHVLISSNVLWHDGEFVHTRCFTRDVTDQEQAQRALTRSENIKAAILDAALDAVITMDADGRITDFNPAAARTFRHLRSEAIGRSVAELIVPERLRARHVEGLARYLATNESRVLGKRLEQQALHAAGHEFPVELSINADLFREERRDSPAVFIVLDYRPGLRDLGEVDQLKYFIEHRTVAPNGVPGPFGLTQYRKIGRQDEHDYLLGTFPDSRQVLFECGVESVFPSAQCQTRSHIGGGVTLRYRFKRPYLSQWQAIDVGVRNLIRSFEVPGDGK